MINETQTGLQANGPSSVRQLSRGARGGEQMVSELRNPYYQSTKDGYRFSASIQAVSTTTVGLATTYTGLVISNPITSTIDMSIDIVSIMQSVIQATQVEAYAIACGFNATTNVTHTTPLTVRSKLIGSGITGQGLADISATLPTAPFYDTFIHDTAAASTNGTGSVVDLKGSIILPPGGYALWVTPAQASVAGLWFSMSWEEIPR